MPAVPQGMFSFPGVNPGAIRSGSFTLGHGISPSACVIAMVPQRGYVAKTGTLGISYGGVRISFPDSCADRLERIWDDDGHEMWTLHILDRRWKWKFGGRISGYYNVRRDVAGGEPGKREIIPETEKSPRELAQLCLDAMGETRYALYAMPDTTRPEIEWDYTLPAEALACLCEAVGCRVVLRLDNSVLVVKVGEGRTLSLDYTVTAGGIALDTPEQPDSLVVTSSHIRWQQDLPLEPVGLDLDCKIKPVEELSYQPFDPQSHQQTWYYDPPPYFGAVLKQSGVQAQQLAQESVWRWYRVKPPFSVPLGYDIESLDRILPIEDKQIQTLELDGRIEPRPAWVYGVWQSGASSWESYVSAAEIAQNVGWDTVNEVPKGYYNRPFSVDGERGIVKFSEAVYQINPITQMRNPFRGGECLPARLWLRTAFSVRDAETRGWIRGEQTRGLPGRRSNTQPRYVVHDDISYNYVTLPGGTAWDTSQKAGDEANYYLDALIREYQTTNPGTVSYAGIRRIDLDGAIQQVTWTVAESGYATTQASRNREELFITPSYDERRMFEQLRVALAQQQTPSQQQTQQKKSRA